MATTDQASLFSPRKYYRIGNINLPGAFLSANPITTTGGTVSLSLNGSLSSENWQLFAQSGRYFIRNYDFGSSLQLGLSAPSQDIPRMSMSQGLIQQQWSITGTTGGYYLANGLWGNDITLAIGTQLDVNMRPNASANIWSITENASAANSKQPIQDGVSSFEVRACGKDFN